MSLLNKLEPVNPQDNGHQTEINEVDQILTEGTAREKMANLQNYVSHQMIENTGYDLGRIDEVNDLDLSDAYRVAAKAGEALESLIYFIDNGKPEKHVNVAEEQYRQNMEKLNETVVESKNALKSGGFRNLALGYSVAVNEVVDQLRNGHQFIVNHERYDFQSGPDVDYGDTKQTAV